MIEPNRNKPKVIQPLLEEEEIYYWTDVILERREQYRKHIEDEKLFQEAEEEFYGESSGETWKVIEERRN